MVRCTRTVPAFDRRAVHVTARRKLPVSGLLRPYGRLGLGGWSLMTFVHDDDNCDVANTHLCPGPAVCGGAERAEREARAAAAAEAKR